MFELGAAHVDIDQLGADGFKLGEGLGDSTTSVASPPLSKSLVQVELVCRR